MKIRRRSSAWIELGPAKARARVRIPAPGAAWPLESSILSRPTTLGLSFCTEELSG